MASLEERIIARDAAIAVLGLGYVGLPLAVEFAESGFTVSGVDLDGQKVATLNAGGSYVADVPAERVAPLVRRGRLRAVTDYARACRSGGDTRGPDVILGFGAKAAAGIGALGRLRREDLALARLELFADRRHSSHRDGHDRTAQYYCPRPTPAATAALLL